MSGEILEDFYTDDDFPLEVDVPFHCDEDGEEEVAFFQIADFEQLRRINRLAAEFYALYGYVFIPENDFFGSSHPQEYACFIRACSAYYLLIECQPKED